MSVRAMADVAAIRPGNAGTDPWRATLSGTRISGQAGREGGL
jgi:hypothetical protein